MGQEHVARQNRRQLLERVRTMWIEGVLEHSLHQAALIALDLQEQPDALAHPWHLESQETNQPPHPLPAGTSIVQVYDQAWGSFLLLGEPGAGKTTLLLELARTLVERAEADEHQPLPVVFHLSSWALTRPPLSDWLVEELRTTYQVPRALGKAWIAANQILPLLDGLDEVAEEARPGCVQAINAYRERQLEKGAAPLVVCCRSQDYAALPTRVTLHQAVSIQPLTQDQIEGYLQITKGQLEGLRQALHQDPELFELAQRPLMLSILTLAYQGAGPEELPTEGTHEAHQQQVFASYIERMLSEQGISRHATHEQMLRWLRWLATQMQRQHQTVFFLEQLQPGGRADRGRRLLYQLVFGLVGGLLLGLVSGLVYGLLDGLVGGLLVGLVSGLVAGLVYGLSINQLDELRPNQGIWRSARNGLVSGLVNGLVIGLVVGLINGLLSGLSAGLLSGLSTVLSVGLFYGLLYGLGAFFQHFALRIFLWRAGSLPRNVVAFLDEAAERLLLRKVGRGYIFMHRLLLDYFASL